MDTQALTRAAQGMQAVVHLAGVPERDDFATRLVPNNIVGTANVLEVARRAGVERFIYASSCRVVGGLDWNGATIGLDAGLVPGDHYGVSKATGELLCRLSADRHAMTVIAARLGWFVRNRTEAAHMDGMTDTKRIYLSHRDAVAFFCKALTQPVPTGFHTVFVVSHNAGQPAFDPNPARQLLHFEPCDSWPEGSSWSDDVEFPSPIRSPSFAPDRGE